METKKVIEQEKGFDIYVFDTEYGFDLIQGNPEIGSDSIAIEKSTAREVALAICPELGSQLAEKDKEIEEFESWLIRMIEGCDDLGGMSREKATYQNVLKKLKSLNK